MSFRAPGKACKVSIEARLSGWCCRPLVAMWYIAACLLRNLPGVNLRAVINTQFRLGVGSRSPPQLLGNITKIPTSLGLHYFFFGLFAEFFPCSFGLEIFVNFSFAVVLRFFVCLGFLALFWFCLFFFFLNKTKATQQITDASHICLPIRRETK